MTLDPLVSACFDHLSSELSRGCDCLQVTPSLADATKLALSGPPKKNVRKTRLTNYTIQESNIAFGQSPFKDDFPSRKPPFYSAFSNAMFEHRRAPLGLVAWGSQVPTAVNAGPPAWSRSSINHLRINSIRTRDVPSPTRALFLSQGCSTQQSLLF